MSVCSVRYPACNAHVPYCYLWPVLLYNIFPHYLINGTILGIMFWNTKCVLIFPTILYEKFLILTRIKPQIITNFHSCSGKVPVIIGQILVKLEFSGQIFEKSTEKSNLMNIRPIGRPAVQCGRTDGRTDTTKLIVFFFAIF